MASATADEPLAVNIPPLGSLVSCLHDLADPVPKRMRAIYYLRLLASDEAIVALSDALLDRRCVALSGHHDVLNPFSCDGACAHVVTELVG